MSACDATDDAIARLVEAAPPLDETQRTMLRDLLNPSGLASPDVVTKERSTRGAA